MNNDRYYVLYNKDYKEGDDAESFELEDYKYKGKTYSLRYAQFFYGDTFALVSSELIPKELEKALTKKGDTHFKRNDIIFIDYCDMFQLEQSHFNDWSGKGGELSHPQVKHTDGNYYDYEMGTNEDIDELFRIHYETVEHDSLGEWQSVDTSLTLYAPTLCITEITDVYDEDEFDLYEDFDRSGWDSEISKEYLERINKKRSAN